jgi:histidyl-tRNA synthetase
MGVAEQAGVSSQLNQMTVAIDKWDKIGEEGVRAEMEKRGLEKGAMEEIMALLQSESLEALKAALKSASGLQGIDEVEQVFAFLDGSVLSNTVSFDPRLARGLDYYTGCIFEVSALDAEMGSLGGGGRYADLTGVFGLPGTPGVGISFGAERIFDVMEAKSLFPQDLISAPRLLFITLDQASLLYAFQAATALRRENIAVDIYPEVAKLQKQMRFANQTGVPYVALVGEQERLTGKVTLKDMKTGDQQQVHLSDLKSFL